MSAAEFFLLLFWIIRSHTLSPVVRNIYSLVFFFLAIAFFIWGLA